MVYRRKKTLFTIAKTPTILIQYKLIPFEICICNLPAKYTRLPHKHTYQEKKTKINVKGTSFWNKRDIDPEFELSLLQIRSRCVYATLLPVQWTSRSKFFVYIIEYIKCVTTVVFVYCKHFAVEIPGRMHKFVFFEFLYEHCVLLSNVVHHQELLFHLFAVFHDKCFTFRTYHPHDNRSGSTVPISGDSVNRENVVRVYINFHPLF